MPTAAAPPTLHTLEHTNLTIYSIHNGIEVREYGRTFILGEVS